MTPKELRAAAENVLGIVNQPPGWVAKINDSKRLAEHILATVREDDGEPVTMEWVEAFNLNDLTIGMNKMHYLPHDMVITYKDKTRGQFRKLREGLGIVLKENAQ
jgi:hypothetical protein